LSNFWLNSQKSHIFFNLAAKFQEVLLNTRAYRTVWKEKLKDKIVDQLTTISKEVELEAKIEVKSELENLEAIVFSLGTVKSGMYQEVNDSIKRHMIKQNGSLIYQQLFNGKVIVIINYPFIEGYIRGINFYHGLLKGHGY